MSIDLGCFPENIIGLSQNDCECFTIDENTSISGFFLDEAEGMNLRILDAVNDCESGSLSEMMKWARAEAIKITKSEIMKGISLSKNVELRLPNWSGSIGDTSFSKTLQVNKTMAGLRQVMKPLRGGIMRVKRIATTFSGVTTFNIGLYDNSDPVQLNAFSVTTQANRTKWTDLSEPLLLPMWDRGKVIQYFWLFAVNQSNLPKDAPVHCGCGNTPLWTYPQQWFQVTQARYNWSQWAMVAGVQGNNIDDRVNWDSMTDKSFGIALDVDFICNMYQTLCEGGHDFDNDPSASDLAQTIRMKATELLLGKILLNTDISPYTSQNAEVLAQIAGQQRADFINNVADLVTYFTMPEHISEHADCYECKNASGFRISGIYS